MSPCIEISDREAVMRIQRRQGAALLATIGGAVIFEGGDQKARAQAGAEAPVSAAVATVQRSDAPLWEVFSGRFEPVEAAPISIAPEHEKNGGDQAIGRSRGGLTTKIHAVDALGSPVALSLTPGQAHDLTQAASLLEEVEPEAFLADKAYDANALIETSDQRGMIPVIPTNASRSIKRKTDFALYRERNLVERFFCKLEGFRAIATRYDKLANTFLAAVQLVSVLFWLN